MTKSEAKKIIGNTQYLKNMHRALSLHRWHNTIEEEQRLEAACILLNKKYNIEGNWHEK